MGVHWVRTLTHSPTLLTFRGVLEPEKEHTEKYKSHASQPVLPPQSATNALYLYKLTHAFHLDLMEHSGES